MINVKVKRINGQEADLKYSSEEAACFDLVSNDIAIWQPVYTGKMGYQVSYEAVISTGYIFEIPKGYRMDIYPRSGWGFKHNIQLANGTGKIDSDYRGEVKVKLIAFCKREYLPVIKKGDRIAQAEINPVYVADFEYVDSDLSETTRGTGGFGSTGVVSI